PRARRKGRSHAAARRGRPSGPGRRRAPYPQRERAGALRVGERAREPVSRVRPTTLPRYNPYVLKRLALVLGLGVLTFAPAAGAATPRVLAIRFDTEVNPVTQGYLSHQLHRAARQHYGAAVILLDTPGRLSDSMP